MNTIAIIVILVSLGIIVSGILLLKQSAKKFNLSDEQKEKIKARQKELEQEED
ncbi:DUF2897 family protein [Thalassotalea agarivorans]|uniref:DUF2897 domain-containing protein n=1 Tax=Thalassotalea agarivorans TaxID=349064 RepID=A0A1I0FDG3_THASX|nr:DUF2897 family protein [Thalassotalea agarivorans]SET55244.1 Protein of unknown function [Thalassotalea agarivorans]